jgi:UDP-glucuronate decarboxylase
MKVLITGGYGFIGSHVAEQFHKEGYEIFIIDDLSTGKQSNVKVKHKAYLLSVTDPKCLEIFSAHHFDVVIHLAAQVNVTKSINDPKMDADHNILGLLNMLECSVQTKVKKFINASSAAVYGNTADIPLKESSVTDPINPYGLNKLTGEKYCNYYSENFAIQTINLRFANVYGPRQMVYSDGSVIATFINRVINNESITVHGDGNQTRDFIYVKDLAFLIHRITNSSTSGTYNVSSNSQITINELAHTLEKITGNPLEINYAPKRVGDILHSQLDNSLVKHEIDWVPIHSLEYGLSATLEFEKTSKLQKNKATSKDINTKKTQKNYPLLKRLLPYTENILLFALISPIVIYFDNTIITPFVFGMFYIIVIGALYGNKQAFISVVFAIALLIVHNQIKGREILSLLYDTTFLFQTVTFLFVGLVVGYSIQEKNNKILEQDEKYKDLKNNYNHLEKVHFEIRDIKDELQDRIRNSDDSFGKIYSIIKELDNLEPEKIFNSTVPIVEELLQCNDVSIYLFNSEQSYLRLVARSNVSESKFAPNSIKVTEAPFAQKLMRSDNIFVNHTFTKDSPLMAAPLFYENEIKAIITINDIDFRRLSKYYENLFLVVTRLIESSISKAFLFDNLMASNRYIANTTFLTADTFEKILEIKEESEKFSNSTFQLLTCPIEMSQLEQISKEVKPLLRETDYVTYKNNHLIFLLSNINYEDLPAILNRFEKIGLKSQVIEKVGV